MSLLTTSPVPLRSVPSAAGVLPHLRIGSTTRMRGRGGVVWSGDSHAAPLDQDLRKESVMEVCEGEDLRKAAGVGSRLAGALGARDRLRGWGVPAPGGHRPVLQRLMTDDPGPRGASRTGIPSSPCRIGVRSGRRGASSPSCAALRRHPVLDRVPSQLLGQSVGWCRAAFAGIAVARIPVPHLSPCPAWRRGGEAGRRGGSGDQKPRRPEKGSPVLVAHRIGSRGRRLDLHGAPARQGSLRAGEGVMGMETADFPGVCIDYCAVIW